MARLRVLISGAGVAGNALAFWLSRLGYEITVVERFAGLRENGLQLDLRSHGVEVLQRMGLEQAFRAHAVPEQGLQVVDSRGKRWGYFPAIVSGKGAQSMTSEYEIMRRDLCKIMYDVTKDRVKYIFGTTIESFEEQPDSLEVRFADGKKEYFDLLVGADGQWSRTRKMMLESSGIEDLRLVDECVAYFTVPKPIQAGEEYLATMYMAPGGVSVLTRRHSPEKMQVYLVAKSVSEPLKSVKRGDVKEEKRVFTETFRGAGWQVDEILDMMDVTDDFYCERKGVVKVDEWSRGRVTLLGDAGYTQDMGMGTTCAMVGAYILAGEIGKNCGQATNNKDGNSKESVVAALKAYDNTFRPFVSSVQKGFGEPSVFDKITWTRFTIGVLNRVLRFASVVRLDYLASWILNHQTSGWSLPDYEDLRNDEPAA